MDKWSLTPEEIKQTVTTYDLNEEQYHRLELVAQRQLRKVADRLLKQISIGFASGCDAFWVTHEQERHLLIEAGLQTLPIES